MKRKKTYNISKTQEEILKVFPEIPSDIAEKIDIKIKAKILQYQSANLNEEIANLINKELNGYIGKKSNKKWKRLVKDYINNNREWILQENWYCLLAYLITITTMVLRIFDVESPINDWITLGGYFVVSVVWIVIVKTKKMMGKKAESVLAAFNHHVSSITVISILIFYLSVCFCPVKFVWVMAIVVPFVICIWLTWHWYKNGK